MEEMDQQESAIERLPDEILLMIFSNIRAHYLGVSVAKVCRRWRRLISHYVVRIQHPGDDRRIHGGLIALLVTSYVPALPGPSAIISRIATMMTNLKELTISVEYSLEESHLQALKKLQHLRHLDVFAQRNVLDEDTAVPLGITSLVANNNMAPGFLRTLDKRGRVFKAFHMYGRAVYYPPREMDRFLKQHSVSLSELTLRCTELTDVKYETIARCVGLTSLQLYSCLQLTSVGATYLTHLTELRRLHITGMRMVRISSLFEFIQRLPRRIEELNLSHSWFGDEHYSALVARLPKLRSLELWRCRISAFCLLQLVKLLTSLEELDTDVLFTPAHIRTLTCHQSLKNVRCRWSGQIKTRLNMTSALDIIPVQFLREDEEGPRAELFYYWTQGVPINTPPASPPITIGPNPCPVLSSPCFWDTELYDWPLSEGFPKSRRKN